MAVEIINLNTKVSDEREMLEVARKRAPGQIFHRLLAQTQSLAVHLSIFVHFGCWVAFTQFDIQCCLSRGRSPRRQTTNSMSNTLMDTLLKVKVIWISQRFNNYVCIYLEVVSIVWDALKLAWPSQPLLGCCYQSIVFSIWIVQVQKRDQKVVHALYKEFWVVDKNPDILLQHYHNEIIDVHRFRIDQSVTEAKNSDFYGWGPKGGVDIGCIIPFIRVLSNVWRKWVNRFI